VGQENTTIWLVQERSDQRVDETGSNAEKKKAEELQDAI
jgi:hypothetical protein